jgi:hypothetical protein
MGRFAVRIEECRTVIPLDHGDRASALQNLLERLQCPLRLGQVLQEEAHEDVIEALQPKGQMKDIAMLELHVPETGGFNALLSFRKRSLGYVNGGDQRLRAIARERDGLSPHSATG